MLALALTAAAAAAEPDPGEVVVTLGDGLVVSVGGAAQAAAPGGIAASLADCLEERAPRRFSVVDRSTAGETLASALPKVPALQELAPAWVVVTLGARELQDPAVDAAKLASDLAGLAGAFGDGKKVVLVGALAATIEGDQAAMDARVAAFNTRIGAIGGVFHLDPFAEWKREKIERAGMVSGGALTAAGQARVAARLCELVLGSKAPAGRP